MRLKMWWYSPYLVITLLTTSIAENPCVNHHDKPCACNYELKCEYDTITKNCVLRSSECPSTKFLPDGCRRQGVWYAHGGVLCKNWEHGGNCEVEGTVFGINFNGLDHTDLNGINYLDYRAIDPERVEENTRYVYYYGRIGMNLPDPDVPLYAGYAAGARHKVAEPGKCGLAYEIPIWRDGVYELSIKAGDFGTIAPGKKTVSFRFNGINIVQEMDLYLHSEAGKIPIDLNVNFAVEERAKVLKITGYPPSPIIDRAILFEVCHGNCMAPKGNFTDVTWHISAFSVAKLKSGTCGRPPPIGGHCSKFNGRHCSCTHAKCEYNFATQKCVGAKLDCSKCELGLPPHVCRRKGGFYLDGGVACRSTSQRGSCQFSKVILAVNLGGPEVNDSNGITYQAWEDRKPDRVPGAIKVYTRLGGDKIDDGWVPNADMPLFEHTITDWISDQSCLEYYIPLTTDGDYEFALKAFDGYYNDPGKRIFDVKLNGIIVKAVDLVFLSGGKFKAVNIIMNFKVQGYGTKLVLPGFPPSAITGNKVVLGICRGRCQVRSGTNYVDEPFHVNAFSIIKFNPPITTYGRSVEGQESCSRPAGPITPENHNPESTGDVCSGFFGKPCACHEALCEYNVDTQDCIPGHIDCAQCETKLSPTTCRRKGAFYLDSGVACRNAVERGNCSVTQVIMAVNLNGPEVTDSSGITYKAGDAVKPTKRPTHMMGDEEKKEDRLVDETVVDQDELLYLESVTDEQSTGGCLEYSIPISDDGDYEFSLKAYDGHVEKPGTRAFDVVLNGIKVKPALDLVGLSGGRLRAVNLIVDFRVSERTMLLPGYPQTEIKNGSITFAVCRGQCGAEGTAYNDAQPFHINAFSVVKFD